MPTPMGSAGVIDVAPRLPSRVLHSRAVYPAQMSSGQRTESPRAWRVAPEMLNCPYEYLQRSGGVF